MAARGWVLRGAPVALSVVALLAVLAVVVSRPDGDDRDGRRSPRAAATRRTTTTTKEDEAVARVEREIERRLAAPSEPVDATAAVDALQSGIEQLLRAPAIEVAFEKQGTDPGAVKATAVVQPGDQRLDQRRTMALETGGVLTEDRRVVDGIVYVRTDDELSPDLPAPWDRAPSADLSERDVDRALTGEGAAGSSLTELTERLRAGRFSATRSEGSSTQYHLRSASTTGPPTAFDFTLGPGGVLTALSTYGTVVVDGEAVDRAIVDITYRAAAARPITAPSAADLRH